MLPHGGRVARVKMAKPTSPHSNAVHYGEFLGVVRGWLCGIIRFCGLWVLINLRAWFGREGTGRTRSGCLQKSPKRSHEIRSYNGLLPDQGKLSTRMAGWRQLASDFGFNSNPTGVPEPRGDRSVSDGRESKAFSGCEAIGSAFGYPYPQSRTQT
jgi:hypothetical protein